MDTTLPAFWHVRRNGKVGPALATSILADNGDTRCDAGESLIFYADVPSTRVELQAIYDDFGDGRPDPAAIQHFLNYTLAAWSSSGQSPLRGQDVLLERLLATWLADPAAGMTLGQAVLAAKLHLYGAGGGAYASALDTFHLFGDPATVCVFLPVVQVSQEAP